jgi:hypothetical protein
MKNMRLIQVLAAPTKALGGDSKRQRTQHDHHHKGDEHR